MTSDLFGTPQQQAFLGRGRALYEVIRDDPRFSYYGRSVGLADTTAGDVALLVSLTRLQGASSFADLPDADLPLLRRAVEDQGLSTTHYQRWSGGAEAIAAARAIRDGTALPTDVTLHRIDADSDSRILNKLAEISLACGVLPITGSVLRGMTRPGTGIVALDATGRPVACAAAAAYLHPGRDNGECWWGMLATDPARRGERLALRLGAEALLDITERFGFSRVFTGITPGNGPSETVCARMGLTPEDRSVISAADPTQLTGGRMTK